MTKRQKVREGIADIFDTPLTDSEDGEIKTPRQLSLLLAKKIVDYLHSQDVVIKVDKELPEQPSFTTYPKVRSDGRTNMTYQIFKVGQHSLIEAGFGAFEPLIEEKVKVICTYCLETFDVNQSVVDKLYETTAFCCDKCLRVEPLIEE